MKRMTIEGAGGVRLAVVDFGGEGPGILLVHGMMGRATTWASTAQWLTPYGHVVGYDARGHGLSDSPDGPYDRASHIADAVAVMKAFKMTPAIVIGHSMGGLTAWQLAGAHPDLVRAIVIGDMARDPSVSMMGAYGGVAHGWAQIEERIESSAARYAGWEPVYEEELITSVSGHDFAYIVLRERVSDRAGSGEAPRSRRVTVLFHREDDAWRIVHHHSDPLNDLPS